MNSAINTEYSILFTLIIKVRSIKHQIYQLYLIIKLVKNFMPFVGFKPRSSFLQPEF